MQPEALFPISLKLTDKHCLIVGGGPIALAKAKPLLETGAIIHVSAEHLLPEFQKLVKNGEITLVGNHLGDDLCSTLFLAIDSGEYPECSPHLASLANTFGFLLNVADKPDACDYFTPATVRRGPVQIAISTGGAAPALARNIRQILDRLLPARLGEITTIAAGYRDKVKRKLQPQQQKQFWNRLFSGSFLNELTPKPNETIKEAIEQLLADAETTKQPKGNVTLVGAGAGSADMITLKGLRALETADVILHDALLDPALLDHARRDARIISVGKRCGQHSASQKFINRSLANLAKQGNRVVRLKCGDPFIFGRGGEELLHLQKEGIGTRVIPGVTAAAVAAADLSLPLTHRGVARRVTFMTASTNKSLPEDQPDWNTLLKGGTVALYMARTQFARTLTEMKDQGLSLDLPLTVIANAGLPSCQYSYGTIASFLYAMPSMDENAPTLILFGECAALMTNTDLPTDLQKEA